MLRSSSIFVMLLALVACGGGASSTAEGGREGDPDGASSGGDRGVGEAPTGEGGASPAPSRVWGRNFSVPLPRGYEQKVSGTIADMMRSDVLEPGGVILMARTSDVPGAVPGSIVVSPTATDISSDAVDEGFCPQLAALVAGQQNATVERAGMITLPWGRTCQWELLTASDAQRRRIGTVFAANAEDWIVTCNLDSRDEAARAACTEVLSGWAFR
jgi:hypothetical protein